MKAISRVRINTAATQLDQAIRVIEMIEAGETELTARCTRAINAIRAAKMLVRTIEQTPDQIAQSAAESKARAEALPGQMNLFHMY